ncbi:MAG: chromosomal replication initiator protein DnaA [Alphaproteobacteria bacterium]|nr:chromosomal replication initiator protein DnaA [Alphaproteobacteria bacterium]
MDEDVDRGDLGQIWQRARARLKASVGDDAFNSWFQRLEMEEILDDVAHLSVPTKFLCSWIESKYVERILACIREEDSTVTRLHLTVRINGQARPRLHPQGEASEDIAPPPPPRIMPVPQQSPRLDALSGSALDPRLTFETFVPGKANEIALGVAKQVASAAMRKTVTFNPVYIHSTVGLGKSHLLNAVAWAAGKADPGLNIVYLTADHFMYHFISAVQRQSAIAFKEWLRRIDLLLIDDMQFLQGKSATEFGHNLSALLSGAKQVVVAGDAPPRDLDMIDERVRSRLSGGLVVPIVTFDFDLRRAIVARRAEMAVQRFPGVHFPGPVIDFIAHAVVSHGRDLDGAVNRLVAANQLTNEAITVQLAERTLADLMRIREVRRVRIEDILKLVSKHFKVPRNDLLSSRRSREVVRPRQIAMYLAKSLTSRSLPEIGRRFGGRDHTTVLHSVRKVEQMMKDDSDLQQEIELLKKMLEE